VCHSQDGSQRHQECPITKSVNLHKHLTNEKQTHPTQIFKKTALDCLIIFNCTPDVILTIKEALRVMLSLPSMIQMVEEVCHRADIIHKTSSRSIR